MSRVTFDIAGVVAHVVLPRTVPNKHVLIYCLFVQYLLFYAIKEQHVLTSRSAENGDWTVFALMRGRLKIFT